MTTPPPPPGPPGPWPNQPPAPGQPPVPPPGYPMPGQQYGPPPGQYPGWPPAGRPKRPNGLKWVLAGVALVAVIAVAVAITAVVLRSDSGTGGGEKGGSSSTSDIASADDTGPVGIITAEPTCDKFMPINNALAAEEQNGWAERDSTIPANEWTAEQRAQYEAIGAAMRNAADQYVTLAKQTPHRVVRELYEQSIAYARAYADSIAEYSARDDQLARTFVAVSTTIVEICDAITYGSAGARSILADPGTAPAQTAPVADPANPARFLVSPDPICADWTVAAEGYNKNLADWMAIDGRISADEWTPEQKSVYDNTVQLVESSADKAQTLSSQTKNLIIRDFFALSVLYGRIYAKAVPTYVAADGYLINTANQAGAIINNACLAAGS